MWDLPNRWLRKQTWKWMIGAGGEGQRQVVAGGTGLVHAHFWWGWPSCSKRCLVSLPRDPSMDTGWKSGHLWDWYRTNIVMQNRKDAMLKFEPKASYSISLYQSLVEPELFASSLDPAPPWFLPLPPSTNILSLTQEARSFPGIQRHSPKWMNSGCAKQVYCLPGVHWRLCACKSYLIRGCHVTVLWNQAFMRNRLFKKDLSPCGLLSDDQREGGRSGDHGGLCWACWPRTRHRESETDKLRPQKPAPLSSGSRS